MKIFDVVQPKETDKLDEQTGKPITRWQNLGIAFEKEGRITGIKLEALPLPDNKGEVWIRLFEQKPKENKSYGEPIARNTDPQVYQKAKVFEKAYSMSSNNQSD